ncbi:MAG: Gmad2 immunoglobulin-like domain-containing protein [Parcubacteria group bacterium]
MQNARNTRNVHRGSSKKMMWLTICIIGIIILVFIMWLWRGHGDGVINDQTKDAKSQTGSMERVKPEKEMIELDSKKVAEGINIRVTSPHVNETIVSPLTITGEAKNWYFEASFPVKLVDEKGNVLSEGIAQAKGDWMVDDYVPFEVELKFDANGALGGDLVFQKSNPSGLPENAGSFSFPVFFK